MSHRPSCYDKVQYIPGIAHVPTREAAEDGKWSFAGSDQILSPCTRTMGHHLLNANIVWTRFSYFRMSVFKSRVSLRLPVLIKGVRMGFVWI